MVTTATRAANARSRRRWLRRAAASAVTGVAVCAGAVVTSGCGFRLRGSGPGLSGAGRVFVDADRDSTLARGLIAALRERSLSIAPDRDAADVLLRLSGESIEQRVVSVQSTGRVSELELTHAVDFVLAQSMDGQPPVYDPAAPGNRVRVAREFTYDETQVLGKANEEATLRAELRAELVRQIVLRAVASLS